MFQQLRFALDYRSIEQRKVYSNIRISMNYIHKNIANAYFYCQLFRTFSN